MSVWERNGVWYYQFRYRGKQYSGRAEGARTREEAKEIEEDKRTIVYKAFTPLSTEDEDHVITLEKSHKEVKITFSLDRYILEELMENGTTELVLRLKLEE